MQNSFAPAAVLFATLFGLLGAGCYRERVPDRAYVVHDHDHDVHYDHDHDHDHHEERHDEDRH